MKARKSETPQGEIGCHSALFVAEFVAKRDFLMFEVDFTSLEWGSRARKKRGWNPSLGTIRASKNIINKRKTASCSEAASSVATNSHLAGGVYRARTYDLHDVNVTE
ncbi:MAG: hypothetical protein IJ418_21605 [Clostridia bacterium]|nr:hypothetical protein [Clostridia bacterium]